MNMCSGGHDEIVFEGRDCPVCILIEDHRNELEEKDSKITDLEKDIEKLQEEVDSLTPDDTDHSGE